ncbi:flagellar export protein FliJ [Geovibrio ferrireducens]|jgi:flagellar FliJ protein|uniref:flagellar export protein FliJ n=1 Tax=Geovibrio ferrireducens TaxID=46201 RepID=UPI0022476CD7|nr:flagellar export protein FliJ [Geovibrio ferrireducens]
MNAKFRLEKVLEHRERIFELEKNKLAEFESRLRTLTAQLTDMLETEKQKHAEKEEAKISGQMQFVRMYDAYILKLEGHRKTMERMVHDARLVVERQKKKTVQAMNNHKIMLKLKEKHVKDYSAYLDKEEMKMIDELIVSRSGRNE